MYEFTKSGPNCEASAVVPYFDKCKDAAAQLKIPFKVANIDKVKRPAGCYKDGDVGAVYFNRKINPEQTDPMKNGNWSDMRTQKGAKRFIAICIKDSLSKNQNIYL